MSTNSKDSCRAGSGIIGRVVEAKKDNQRKKRASEPRYPFFRPVRIYADDGQCHAGFSRDISTVGIGFIHTVELPTREVDIGISSDRGYTVKIRTRIVWTQSRGEGWYLSGGEFVGPALICG